MAIFGMIIGIIAVLCAVWIIYDVLAHQKSLKMEYKILWIIAAVIFSIVAAIAYYFVQKR